MEMNPLVPELTHDELLEVTNSSLCTIISCDSLLSDLPPDITLEEVLSQTAVEHGQSITIYIARDSEPSLQMVKTPSETDLQKDLQVARNVTVRELKRAIANSFTIYQQRIKNTLKVSWKYIWKTYDLNFEGITLDDDLSSIEDYGVCNKVTLQFKKKKRKI